MKWDVPLQVTKPTCADKHLALETFRNNEVDDSLKIREIALIANIAISTSGAVFVTIRKAYNHGVSVMTRILRIDYFFCC